MVDGDGVDDGDQPRGETRPAEAKQALRLALRARRRAIDPAERAAQTARVADRVIALLAAGPPALGSYLALPEELDLDAVHRHWWATGRPVWLPRVLGPGRLAWHPVLTADHLRPGRFGIREPDPERIAARPLPEDALLLVPGTAFDAAGGRLGMGGGFYDRVLPHHRGDTVGIAFAEQRIDRVPREAHDLAVGRVIFGD